MNKSKLCQYRSRLCQIAYSAARESGQICKELYSDNTPIQTVCALARRKRRLILGSIYNPGCGSAKRKRYRIRSVRKTRFPAEKYHYICKRMTYLADRQSRILHLCRLYSIPPVSLTNMLTEQALAFTLICYHLSHENTAISDDLCRAILTICRDTVKDAEEFAWLNGGTADHRALMRRDIADEFQLISNGILEILTLTLIA